MILSRSLAALPLLLLSIAPPGADRPTIRPDRSRGGRSAREEEQLHGGPCRGKEGRRARLLTALEGEDPADKGFDVLVLNLRVGRHWHLTPDALSALFHLGDQLRLGTGVALEASGMTATQPISSNLFARIGSSLL